jgi:hypothetical protein
VALVRATNDSVLAMAVHHHHHHHHHQYDDTSKKFSRRTVDCRVDGDGGGSVFASRTSHSSPARAGTRQLKLEIYGPHEELCALWAGGFCPPVGVVRSAQKYWILYAGFNGFFAFRFSLFARAPSSYFVRLFVRCLGARKNYNYNYKNSKA